MSTLKKYSYRQWKEKIVNYIFSKGTKKKDGKPTKHGLQKLIKILPEGIKFHDSVQEFDDSEIDETFQIQGHKPKSETGRAPRKSELNKKNLDAFLSKTFSITSKDLCFEINMCYFARWYRPEAALRCLQTFKSLLLCSTYHTTQRLFQERTLDLGNSITLRSFTEDNYRIISMQKNGQNLVRMQYAKNLNPNLPEMGLDDISADSPLKDLLNTLASCVRHDA